MNITVTSTRGASQIKATTKGRYVSFTTAGISIDLPREPIITTSSLKAFWLSVLDSVTAQVNALP